MNLLKVTKHMFEKIYGRDGIMRKISISYLD